MREKAIKSQSDTWSNIRETMVILPCLSLVPLLLMALATWVDARPLDRQVMIGEIQSSQKGDLIVFQNNSVGYVAGNDGKAVSIIRRNGAIPAQWRVEQLVDRERPYRVVHPDNMKYQPTVVYYLKGN